MIIGMEEIVAENPNKIWNTIQKMGEGFKISCFITSIWNIQSSNHF